MSDIRIIFERIADEVGVALSHTLRAHLDVHVIDCGSKDEAEQTLADIRKNQGFYADEVFIPWHQVRSIAVRSE